MSSFKKIFYINYPRTNNENRIFFVTNIVAYSLITYSLWMLVIYLGSIDTSTIISNYLLSVLKGIILFFMFFYFAMSIVALFIGLISSFSMPLSKKIEEDILEKRKNKN